MNITVVCDILCEENNGVVVAAMNLIRYLKAEGHNVKVLCTDQTKKGKPDFYVVPHMNFGKILNKFVDHVGVSLAKVDKDVINASIKDADHIHIMMPLVLGTVVAKMAFRRGISLTAGFHMQAENLTNYVKMSWVPGFKKFVYKFIYKHVFSRCGGVHYPTKFIQDVFEGAVKHSTPGYVISNGYQECFEPKQVDKPDEYKDKFVILSTGRYSVEKSQDTLIKAVAKSKYKDKIQVILAGQGIKDKKFCKLAKNKKVATHFELYDRDELVNVVNYSDLYVHPAISEIESIACLEAMRCNKLTIVSDSNGNAASKFALNDKCIFKKKSAKDLARLIDYWIEHPEEKAECETKYADYSYLRGEKECIADVAKMIEEVHAKNIGSCDDAATGDGDNYENENEKSAASIDRLAADTAAKEPETMFAGGAILEKSETEA